MTIAEDKGESIDQFRGHLQILIKRTRNISVLCSGLLVALLAGFESIDVYSFKVNFFYGSVAVYLIMLYAYFLNSQTLKNICSIGRLITKDTNIPIHEKYNKLSLVVANEPGFFNPLSKSVYNLIVINSIPFIIYFIVANISLPIISEIMLPINYWFALLTINLLGLIVIVNYFKKLEIVESLYSVNTTRNIRLGVSAFFVFLFIAIDLVSMVVA